MIQMAGMEFTVEHLKVTNVYFALIYTLLCLFALYVASCLFQHKHAYKANKYFIYTTLRPFEQAEKFMPCLGLSFPFLLKFFFL